MNFKAPRGTHDVWGSQAEKLHYLEESCRRIFKSYNYAEMRTPIFEDAGLFTRSIGEATDIVEKEMYVFEDRKGRKLSLRPEGTASVVRAYLENQLPQQLPVGKLFYTGSMFRYERPQAGRYREFFQIGVEYFGNPAPSADAETIILARDVLAAVGLKEIKIHLNTLGCEKCRPAFRQALKDYFSSVKDLCADCVRRLETNPLRLLDCKIDGPRFTDLPKMEDHLCEECKAHFCTVQELLTKSGCGYEVDHRMVRGIDYYTRTIFEVRSSHLGSQDALAAGGRYDNLVKELGGAPTPSVGFALGSERVMMAVDNQNIPWNIRKPFTVFVAVSGKELENPAFALAVRLRQEPVDGKLRAAVAPEQELITVEGPFFDKSLKSQLRLADKLGADKVVIFGEEEFKQGAVIVRDMKTQAQTTISITA